MHTSCKRRVVDYVYYHRLDSFCKELPVSVMRYWLVCTGLCRGTFQVLALFLHLAPPTDEPPDIRLVPVMVVPQRSLLLYHNVRKDNMLVSLTLEWSSTGRPLLRDETTQQKSTGEGAICISVLIPVHRKIFRIFLSCAGVRIGTAVIKNPP